MAIEIQERMARSGQFTIAAGGNLSSVVDLRGMALISVLVPTSSEVNSGSLLQVEASIDGTTWAPIESSQAQAVFSFTPGTAAVFRCMPDIAFTGHYIRLHTVNSSGANVTQTSARSISWMGKS